MERGTYLVVERAREGAVRALLKKACVDLYIILMCLDELLTPLVRCRWLLEDKPARLSVEKFQWYYARGAGIEIDKDEVECILANMIFKVSGNVTCSVPSSLTLVVLAGSDEGLHLPCSRIGGALKREPVPVTEERIRVAQTSSRSVATALTLKLDADHDTYRESSSHERPGYW